MKALLLKDVCVLYKQLKILLLVLVAFAFMPGMSASIFAMVYAIMLPITTLSYDERSKWNLMAAMMPYTTRQLVTGKYLLGYMGSAIVMLLTALSQLFFGGLDDGRMSVLLIMPCIGALVLALLLPVMFRFGTEKGRLAYILAAALLAGLSAGIEPQALPPLAVSPVLLYATLYGIAVVVSLLSIRLSIYFYEKQRV